MESVLLTTPLNQQTVQALRSGDHVLLTGRLYTARDAAHRRLCETIASHKQLPIDLHDQIVYFTGPSPTRPGSIIGSAGPTTSSRMDAYSPLLITHAGLRGIIGKGNRSDTVIEAMQQFGCVYFAALGGAGALIAEHITACTAVCYEELGPEAVYRLDVKNLPLIVAIDCWRGNLYIDGPAAWRQVAAVSNNQKPY
jgi:fumarate hydratase subunit beta